MRSEVRYDFDKLNRFVKAVSTKHVVKVGIMGQKNARREAGMTNARLGAIHELGLPNRGIPPRSFLRMPIARQQGQILKEASQGALELLFKGDVVTLLKRLGIAAENAVQAAFASGGFGMWKQLKAATIRRKQRKGGPEVAILIDTTQLRWSITSKVEAV